MAESHSKGEQRHRPIAPAVSDSRTAMSRASDGRPFRPYVYRGGDREPPAVTAARQRWRAITRDEESMPDMAPGPERYRELAAESEDPPRRPATVNAHVISLPGPAPVPALALGPALDDGEMDEMTAARDRWQAALAAVPEPRKPGPPAAPPLVTAPARCRRCKYLTTSAGHRVMCDE